MLKKAVALEETRPSFHVNLGAAWFSQKKLERAVAEYTRALELDVHPDPAAHHVELRLDGRFQRGEAG